MARLDAVSETAPAPRQRKGKGNKSKHKLSPDDPTPFIRPSEITGTPSSKPLVDLSIDDLRTAGVTFTEGEGGEPLLEGLKGVRIPRADPPEQQEEEEEEDEWEDEGVVGDDGLTASERAMTVWWDEFFDSMVYTIPFSFLFLLLDILSNQSYAVERTKMYYVKNYAYALLTIGVLCFYTNRHMATSKICQFLATVVSIGASTRVIWLINKASYLAVMQQGPAFGTIWIISIVMLPLGRALISLAVWYAWVRYYGFNLTP